MGPCVRCGGTERYENSRQACKICARRRATKNRDPKTRKLYYIENKKVEIANTLRRRTKDPAMYLKYMNDYYAKNKESAAQDYLENPILFKNRSLQTRFGWSLEDYSRVLESQDGGCSICRASTPDKTGIRKYFFVDHDHETNEIRGLLCHLCNFGLGCYLDDPSKLRIAALYLENHLARVSSGASLGKAKPKLTSKLPLKSEN